MTDRPNIVFITSQATGRHLGCYGVDAVQTPTLDRIADDGHCFTNFWATSGISSPARAAMMSGLYPQRNGVLDMVHAPYLSAYRAGVKHISHVLRDAGYHTAMFHYHHEARDINTLGFEAVYARHREYKADRVENFVKAVRGDGYRRFAGIKYGWNYKEKEYREPLTTTADWEDFFLPADRVAEEFAEFVREKRPEDRPFYAQIGFYETRRPFDFGGVAPDKSRGVYVPGHLPEDEGFQRFGGNQYDAAPNTVQPLQEDLALFQGAVRKMDSAVGTICRALEQSGLSDNTIFVYTTDNGIDFRKSRMYLYDPGIAAGLIMRWPDGGIAGGRKCNRLLSNVDLFPTLLELASVPVPQDIDGISFTRLFADDSGTEIRDAVFAQMPWVDIFVRESRCIRTDRYKLIRNFSPTVLEIGEFGPDFEGLVCPFVQLFDLAGDPAEWSNLAEEAAYSTPWLLRGRRASRDPDTVAADRVHNDARVQLDRRLMQWMKDVDDPILRGRVPSTYYLRGVEDFREAVS